MKRLISLICSVCLLAAAVYSGGPSIKAQNADLHTGEADIRQDTYKAYCQKNRSVPSVEQNPTVLQAADYTNASGGGISIADGFAGKEKKLLMWKSSADSSSVTWRFNLENCAKYQIKLTYYALESNSGSIDLGLKINGEYPFSACRSIGLSKVYENETEEFQKDSAGNEKRPAAKQAEVWQSTYLNDSEGVTNDPYEFIFFEGENTVTLEGISTDFVLESINLVCAEETVNYQTYSDEAGDINCPDGTPSIIIQGEKMTYRSDSSIIPMEDRSSADTQPSDPVFTRYNTVGDTNWQSQGQWIYWEFTVEEAGLYNIGMRVRQNFQRGYASARRVYIDGKVPFGELLQVEFDYSRGWYFQTLGSENTDFDFYFDEGIHSIAMQIIPGDTAELNTVLQESVTALNKLYRSIIMLTGTSPDIYRDYSLEKEIPNLIEDMTAQRDILKQQYELLQNKYGGRDGDTATLQRLIVQLDGYINDAETIVNSISSFSSNISSLSSWVVRLKEQPLEIDYIELKPKKAEYTDSGSSFFGKIMFSVKQFIGSFVTDYSAVGSVDGSDKESINVWVSLGRDQSQLIRELVDNDFSKQYGIPVSIKLSKGSLIQATYAGTGPDVTLFVPAEQVISLAVRDALVDFNEFKGTEELLSQFSPEETVGFEYSGGMYGAPLTADVNMMFVRTDIFEELGLKIPETWQQLYDIIPTLQRSHMNIGLPKVTIDGAGLCVFDSLLLQGGQNYYNSDISATAFDTETALDAFKEWTGYYTKYDVPIDYDFYNRFRSGEIPIGIESYTMYNKLSVAAPEISGMWTMVPVPGTVKDAGSIDRSTSVKCTAAVIIDNGCDKESAFEFVKWFAGAEAQAEYGRLIEAQLGEAGRYNTANLKAVPQLPWTAQESALILEQLNAAKGIPQSIAGYYITRNLYNAFRKVTVNNSNPREVLYKYNTQMNEEIERKREEFGLERG